MPRMITGNPGPLAQAAAGAAAVLDDAMERQDRLAREAKQQQNLDRVYELQRRSAERQDEIFRQQQEQLDELGSFAQEQLKKHKIDPNSIGNLRGQDAVNAAEVLIHQNQVDRYRGRVEGKIQTMRDRFGLNSTLPTEGQGAGVAPGVMTDEGVAAAQGEQGAAVDANDPRQVFVQEVENAFQNATTMQEYQEIAAAVDRAMLESVKQEQDAVKRSQMTELMAPFVDEIIRGTKDPELRAALGLAQISYSNGDMEMTDFLEVMLESAREGEDKDLNPYEMGRIRAIQQNRYATIEEQQEALDALEHGEKQPKGDTGASAPSSRAFNFAELFGTRKAFSQAMNRVRAKDADERDAALMNELKGRGLSDEEAIRAFNQLVDDFDL